MQARTVARPIPRTRQARPIPPEPNPGLTPAQCDALHRVYTLILSFSRPEGTP